MDCVLCGELIEQGASVCCLVLMLLLAGADAAAGGVSVHCVVLMLLLGLKAVDMEAAGSGYGDSRWWIWRQQVVDMGAATEAVSRA